MYPLILLLLGLAFAVIQCLIGGVKLVYSLPAYVILGLAALATALPAWQNREAMRPKRLCLAAAAALGVYICLRDLFSPVAYLARTDLFMMLGALAVYLITAVHLTKAAHRMALLWALFGFATVHVLDGLLQFKVGNNCMLLPWVFRPDYGARASGFYICPNHLAGLLEMLAMIAGAICLWGRIRVWVRIAAGYAAVVCLAGVAITGSRGGYLSVVAGAGVLAALSCWMFKRLRRRQFLLFLSITILGFIMVIGGGLFLILRSPALAERVGQVYDPTNLRIYLWRAAVKQFSSAPALGTGGGTYLYLGRHFRSPEVQRDPVHSHEDYLELLGEYGLAGAIFMAIFLAVHIRSGFRGIRRILHVKLKPSKQRNSTELALILGCLSALTAILVHSVMDFNLHIPANTLLVAFLFGILANPTEAWGRTEEARPVSPTWLRFSPALLGGLLALAALRLIPGEYFGERARMALRDQAYPSALAFAQKACARDQTNPDADYYLGEANHFLSLTATNPAERAVLFSQAVAAYRTGLKVFPRNVNIMLKLGRTLDSGGQFAEAETILRKALQEDPNFGATYAYYGVHLHLEKHFKNAERYYRKAQELHESEISGTGLQELDRDRKLAAQRNIFADFVSDRDEDEDDDAPFPDAAQP